MKNKKYKKSLATAITFLLEICSSFGKCRFCYYISSKVFLVLQNI